MIPTQLPFSIIVAAGLLGAGLLLVAAIRFSMARLLVLGMMFFACVSVPTDYHGRVYQTWLFPLQAHRSTLYLGLAMILLIVCLFHWRRLSLRGISGQGIAILAIGMYMGLLWFLHEPFTDAMTTLPFMAITVSALVLAVPALISERLDWLRMIRLFALLGMAWVFAAIVQFAINPNLVVLGAQQRFIGVIGNPQHAAVILAICSVAILWLAMYDPKRRNMWIWIGFLGVQLILLAWTGSRTGALMFAIGAAAILFRRVGRAILILPLGVVAVFAALQAAQTLGIDLGAERLVSTTDTRTYAWRGLIEQGWANFWIGVGMRERWDSENSYLTGLASFGIGMLVLMLIFVAVTVVHCFKLFSLGRYLRDWRPYVDLFLGFNLMYLAGTMTEGYLLSRVSFPVVALLIFSGMSARLLYMARTGTLPAAEDQPFAEEMYDDEGEPAFDGEPWTGPYGEDYGYTYGRSY